MKKNFITAVLMTAATTLLLGVLYPLLVTVLAQSLFPAKANGQLLLIDGKIVGSRILAQPFSGAGYFHPRPSAVAYDPTNSNGSQFGPTNQKLIDRVNGDVTTLRAENPDAQIPIDLVTASASGLDPDITPAAAEFQFPRVARDRGISIDQLRSLVSRHTLGRQFGFLGEARVNVLETNLELDQQFPQARDLFPKP